MTSPRDPIFDPEPPRGNTQLAAIVLVPLGLLVIFAGLCLGGWLVSVVHGMLYNPDQVPLVSKVLELIQKDDVVFQSRAGETRPRASKEPASATECCWPS